MSAPVGMVDSVLVAHAASTLMMTGLIWFVQVVHYPLMASVGDSHFASYEAKHIRRTTLVVAPLMLMEVTAAAALLFLPLDDFSRTMAMTGFILLIGIWLSTATLQVPCHRRLEAGLNLQALRRLVTTNAIRTALWSLRSVIAIALVVLRS